MPTDLETPKAINALEACLSQLGPQFKVEAPEQHSRAERLLRALRGGQAQAAETKRVAVELMRWQLGLQRQNFARQLDALAPLLARGVPAAVDSQKALTAVISLLDQSLAATHGPGLDAAALAAFRKTARDVEVTAARAGESVRRSTAGIALKPIFKQPVSESGVRLRAVEPVQAKPKQELAAFKVRFGAVPATPTRAASTSATKRK